MKIQKVALMGAGAVGSYFVQGMTGKEGIDFCLVASGDRAERLSRDGLKINGSVYRPPVVPPEEAGNPDLLLIATKYDGLKAGLGDVRRAAGPKTLVISLLNGIDSEEILAEVIDPAQILRAFMRITSLRKGNEVWFNFETTEGLIFGEENTREMTERAAAVLDLLSRAGLHGKFAPDIASEQWSKFCLNIAYNLPQAVFGTGYRSYFDSEHLGAIRDRMEKEVRTVAAAYGISFPALGNTIDTHPADVRFSTLQDLDNGRLTEVDMFVEALMEKAKAAGLEVPFSEYTRHAIHIREEQNRGLFNY